MRLHLLDLLDLRSSPTVLPSPISHPVETGRAHQKHTIPTRALRGFFHLGQLCAYGGPGGNRTPVRAAFFLKELQQFFNTLKQILQD